MFAIGIFLALFGALLFLFALINVVYPFKALRIRTRKRALLVLLASVVVVILAMVIVIIVDAPPPDATGTTTKTVVPDTSSTSVSQADGMIVAAWESIQTPATFTSKHELIYREGAMMLTSEYSDGSAGSRRVVERPTGQVNERRFDLEPSNERSEYIVLSESGQVTYFSWEGRQFYSTQATVVHQDVLVIGADPVPWNCIPKTLSQTSQEIVDLYEDLHAFKDSPEFARVGFAVRGPYHSWLESVKDIQSRSGLESLDELGFLAGDVLLLGMEYMRLAASESEGLERIHNIEQTIKAGLELATCIKALDSPRLRKGGN